MELSPKNGVTIKTARGPVQIVDSAKQVDAALWRNAFSSHYLDSRYYEILEETLRDQFEFHYAILTDASSGARAVQPLFFVNQRITAGLPARFQRLQIPKALDRFLNLKMAVVGCAAGEGQLDCADPWAVEELAETLRIFGREKHAALLLFKDFPARYRGALAALARHGYARIPSMPATDLELDFSSFEEYIRLKIGGGFRSNLRRKLRDNERMGSLDLEVTADASSCLDQLFPLYLQTHERSPFRFEKLTPDYFVQLGKRIPDRARFFLWRDGKRLLAFASCIVHENTMYYLNLGMDYSIALERHLYFVVWRDLVSWALASGLRRIEIGQLNYEAKFRLGLRLAPRDLYVRHRASVFNPFFAMAFRLLQPTRHDPALGKFPNADEL